jgi:hypothetical protein
MGEVALGVVMKQKLDQERKQVEKHRLELRRIEAKSKKQHRVEHLYHRRMERLSQEAHGLGEWRWFDEPTSNLPGESSPNVAPN